MLIDQGGGDFDIEFNYDQIQWEAGQASGGNADGLGGNSARVGFSNGTGDPGTFFELPGSGVPGSFLDSGPPDTALVLNSLNSDVPGRYVFFARSGGISVVFGDDGGVMAAETAIVATQAQSGDLRQVVRANHDARGDAAAGGMSSMVMSQTGLSTSGASVWAKVGGGTLSGDFGGDLDLTHFAG